MSLPIIGALVLAGGVGVGVHLGHSAIAEINPIYYSEAPTRFHSDLTPMRPSISAPPTMLAAAADDAALGTGCIGCRTYPEEYYPDQDPSISSYETPYAAEVQPAVLASQEVSFDPEEARLQEAIRRVERYARSDARVEIPPEIELASAATDGTEAGDEELTASAE